MKKRVLVIGSGGREHALCWKLSQSPRLSALYCAPGNAGIARHANCINIDANDIKGLLYFAQQNKIDITVVGPEGPLAGGIVDLFEANGLKIFGPSKMAAELEASKVFMKELLENAGVLTASFTTFSDYSKAVAWLESRNTFPVVLKADGLAAGKGVIIANDLAEAKETADMILNRREFGDAGARLIVEDYLVGEEASFMAITDGKTILPLATSQDHKAVFDGDKGPNTGGMGAYSPAPVVTNKLAVEVMDKILKPTVDAMERAGRPYKGVLYAGLMIVDGRPWVLEYNCRFGDPEAQPILMRLKSDLLEVIEACVEKRLNELRLEWDERAAVCVVMASGGYPGSYKKGKKIENLDEAANITNDFFVFHAGTKATNAGIVTAGGRVLGVTALGAGIPEAIDKAYQVVESISWKGVHYRHDIGKKAIKHLPKVGIVMGSASDLDIMLEAKKVLEDFGVIAEVKILSAHRTPELAAQFALNAHAKGMDVIIAGAGMAAHLAGAMAAQTTIPVIGVPINSSPLNGLDALLSTIQMPPGIPVATVAIGMPGAHNAAMLALQILGLSCPDIAKKLKKHRKQQKDKILEANKELLY